MVRIENPWLVGMRKMEAQTFLGFSLPKRHLVLALWEFLS